MTQRRAAALLAVKAWAATVVAGLPAALAPAVAAAALVLLLAVMQQLRLEIDLAVRPSESGPWHLRQWHRRSAQRVPFTCWSRGRGMRRPAPLQTQRQARLQLVPPVVQ